MKILSVTRAAAVTLTAAALVVSGGGLASPLVAAAAVAPVNVTAIDAANTSVNARAESVAVVARIGGSASNVEEGSVRITARIVRAGKTKTVVKISPTTGRGRFVWRYGHGRGTYRIGPTRVTGRYTADAGGGSFNYLDYTTGTFSVKSRVLATLRMTKRSGSSTRVAKAYVKAYSPSRGRYVAYSPVAKLKYYSGRAYRTRKTLTLRGGYDRYDFSASTRRTYRVYTRGSSLILGTRTAPVRI